MRILKGQIRKALSGFYYVYTKGTTYQTRARGNFRKRKIVPFVGDKVIFESKNLTDGYILDILPRFNELERPTVANVNQGVIVTSMVKPLFSYNLLDRFLIILENKKIKPIIYLTKIDLLNDDGSSDVHSIQKQYEQIGYPVILGNNLEMKYKGIEVLKQYFPEKLTVFMGQSGSGKSTLLNNISSNLTLATAEISEVLGRGKHTTRHIELIPIDQGLVADTPGFSSIDFQTIEKERLPKLFPEFVKAAPFCKFRECMHANEPGCEVKHRAKEGMIAKSRYDNYLQFLEEIEKRKPVYKKKKE